MVIERFEKMGAEVTGTAGATGIIDFAAVVTDFPSRKGIRIANTGAAPLYAKLVTYGVSAPTVSATNFHDKILPGETRTLKCGRSLSLYIFGTDTYTIVEIG